MPKILDKRDIENFAADLVATLEHFAAATETLDKVRRLLDAATPKTRAARSGAAKGRRGRGGKLDADALLANVAAVKSGISLGELAKIHNVSGARIRQALVKLRSDGLVKMTGNRRTALWHATDVAPKRKTTAKNGASEIVTASA